MVVDDLVGTRARLNDAGYAPLRCNGDRGSAALFLCRDPFGNIIEFTAILGDYLAEQA